MFNLRIAIRIFIFLLITQGSLCLRNVHVVVPEAVERGSKVEMKCLYDLEKEVLYSVKWYRGDREFCRYSPRDVPPLKIFRIPGIEVDREGSDAEKLTIQAATQTASGRYTCEVSADAPSFQTAQVHTHMYVVVLPKSGPSMHGLKRRYRPGMKLKVECISRHSLPAANLSFFINNDAALSQHVLHRVDGETVGGPMTAYSTIQFVVQKHHFVRGKIKIRCTASVYSIYLQSLEKSAEEERIRTTPVSLPEVHEAVVYSIHRLPETNGSTVSGSASTTMKIILLLTYLLPNVLR
ncbi:uncharacterized protein LOC110384399 [Helicoverpa armigera]|uniref:uncharacterized protein LOC110384399 n=1 Tax=Helicoverpa armigera TaxID=29058 RepID=UPI000B3969D2|nr:uncharacterized protein LOC110384399 isoform X1 [Helicoverpa armigera]XP_049696394.1 uncharacterized protein LOC110384399 isoform X2 [Helicoverpa armigera]XP_049696395.1 uncharacterized protein LOC110384399 isoform X3 [Helicoverpa armigera]PZC85111.1 hypothetical protein B5X24_HaOG202875 [Helicoverpa armigera]